MRRCQALAEAMAFRHPVFLAFDAESKKRLNRLGLRSRRLRSYMKFEILIVDSYLLPEHRLRTLRRRAERLVLIDDRGRVPIDCEWVLNTGIDAVDRPYRSTKCRNYLLGPRFHLMRRNLRFTRVKRAETLKRVLVTLGGSPRPALVRDAVRAVRAALPKAEIYVTAERPNGAPDARYLGPRAPMRPLLASCGLAVSAGGQTLYELAYAGVPTVAFATAANQEPNVRGLQRAGTLLAVSRRGNRIFTAV